MSPGSNDSKLSVVRSSFVTLVVLSVVLATVPGGAIAAEDPRFETVVPDPVLTPGGQQVVTVKLYNDAADPDERVERATNVKVVPSGGDTPFQIQSGATRIRTIADGEGAPVSVYLRVPNDVPAGSYDLPLRVTYEFDGDERETTIVRATLRVPERPVFAVIANQTSVAIGERGTATVTMRNVGSATAYETTLTLRSMSPALTLEGSTKTTVHVGPWAVNETKRVPVGIGMSDVATVGAHAMTITPRFVDDGIESVAQSMAVGVTPAPEQSFAIENVTVHPTSASAATIAATIRNTGDRPVHSVVATLEARNSIARVTRSTAPVGSLEAGASSRVTFEVRSRTDVARSPRQFTAALTYQRDEGPTYHADPVSVQAVLPPPSDVLTFDAVNATLRIDESNRLAVRVTNEGDATLTDVQASLLIEPPYTSAAPTSYVSRLEPGESAVVHFEVTTPEDGIETTDALAVRANATTGDGRRVASEVSLVEITIASPDGPGGNTMVIGVGAVVVLALLGAGWWWLNH